jgi:hypothetical protein
MTKKCGGLAAAAAGMAVWYASAAMASPLTIDKQLILTEHNKYRAEVGAPPLTWSEKLAAGAQRWADTIALLGQMKHSGTSGVGENLAFWRGSNPSLNTMIGMWEQEKQLFQPGRFPNVSRDGNWLSVSHYTQMVWRDTTQVGCGIGNNGKTDFLVCWYSPQGNYIGRMPY